MIVAIAASENHQRANVDLHFGRCNWYCIYNTGTKKCTFIENPFRYQTEKAGCLAADTLMEKKINMVVAGRFGSKVVEIFREKKVQMVVTELPRTIKEIINQIK